MKFHLTRVSGNKKTGPIPVSTSSKETCPDTCPFKGNGCYAEGGPLRIHWSKVTDGERGVDEEQFLREIYALPRYTPWRHNQAGDIPHVNGVIDRDHLMRLTEANNRKKGFTYTHHDLRDENVETLRMANEGGFAVNVSVDNISQVDDVKKKGLPMVCVIPSDSPNVMHTDGGTKIVACPADKSDRVSCSTCALCADSKRDYVIGFRPHGSGKKKVDIIAKG